MINNVCSQLKPFAKDTDCMGNKIPSVKGTEQNPLDIADLSEDLKIKIGQKAIELKNKYPHMKRDRLIRKAGEFYNVKFMFQ